MIQKGYDYRVSDNFRQYHFYSKGPKGRLRKAIRYDYIGTVKGHDLYNLGFGDYDLRTKEINDLSISNNGDRDKILLTIAKTVVFFAQKYPGSRILAKGSTPARTRLYQMGISKYYPMISEFFKIHGLVRKEGWQPFEHGVNYNAFLATPN